MKVIIEWEDQFSHWKRYTLMNHQPSAVRSKREEHHLLEKGIGWLMIQEDY